MGEVLVGTASWTDRTLLESGWYPPDVTTAEARLRYCASRFPLLEIDSTYYAPPAEQTVRSWTRRTPPGFTFDIKAFSLLTGHPTRPGALPVDLRPPTGRNVYARDLDPGAVTEVWERFVSALLPMWEAGRLGAVLFQYPRWFPIGRRAKRYILECKRRCEPLQISVEFRNRTWMTEENRAETLDFLRSYGIPYVCVDMPQGHPCSIPPILEVTADLGVIRFHGHSDKWTSHDVHERFGYRYTEEELARWAPRLGELAARASVVHVLMNNCHRDYAQTNARRLADLLRAVPGCTVRPPPGGRPPAPAGKPGPG